MSRGVAGAGPGYRTLRAWFTKPCCALRVRRSGALPRYRTSLSGVSVRRIDYGCLQSLEPNQGNAPCCAAYEAALVLDGRAILVHLRGFAPRTVANQATVILTSPEVDWWVRRDLNSHLSV